MKDMNFKKIRPMGKFRYFKKFAYVFSFLVLINNFVFAADYYSDGIGETEEAAREAALANLASSLYVRVETASYTEANNIDGLNATYITKTSTNLPILGAELDCSYEAKEYRCEARLNGGKVAPIYHEYLVDLRSKISEQTSNIETLTQTSQEQSLANAISLIDEWHRNHKVFLLLAPQTSNEISLGISKEAVINRLVEIQSKAQSLNVAAQKLTQNIDLPNIYIYPAVIDSSNETTPFAYHLKTLMGSRLDNLVTSVERADLFYRGEYLLNKQGMLVTYALQDSSGRVVTTRSIQLLPDAYNAFEFKPKSLDFDKLLHQGYIKSSDFLVELRTNKGMRDLFFETGETVQLFIKLNQPGYFYLLGHTLTTNDKKTYLIDLQDSHGKRKFVQFVNADDANKWISLGEFEVHPPLGVESLQVIASSIDPINSVPDAELIEGYNVVSNNPKKGIKKARGLVRKKKQQGGEYSEAVLMFTTFNSLNIK